MTVERDSMTLNEISYPVPRAGRRRPPRTPESGAGSLLRDPSQVHS